MTLIHENPITRETLLFICGELNEGFNNLHCLVLDVWMTVHWKGCGSGRPWPNLKQYSGNCLEEVKKTINITQDVPEYC
jgi:hypothetical protein